MWNHVGTDVSLLRVIDEKIRQFEADDHAYFPDFSSSPSLFVGSDYSGEHKPSLYFGFTFLFLPVEAWRRWDTHRQKLRSPLGMPNRRLGYAKMGDRLKRAAALGLLETLTHENGLLISLSVRKTLRSIFDSSGQINRSRWRVDHCTSWRKAEIEKMLRVVHTVAFFIAGIASPAQNIRWITDHDAIVVNEERFQEMAVVFQKVLDQYLSVQLNHVSCSTTFDAPLEVEDFAAMPDLVGGAIVDLFNAHAKNGHDISEAPVPRPSGLPSKANEILDRLAQPGVLRRVFYKVEPGPTSGTIRITDVNIATPLHSE